MLRIDYGDHQYGMCIIKWKEEAKQTRHKTKEILGRGEHIMRPTYS